MISEEMKVFSVAVAGFAERGFDGITFARLEEELTLPAGTLAQEYGTLDVLWERAVLEAFNQHHDAVYNRLAAAFTAHLTEIDRFEQLLAIFIASAADHPELQRIINQEGTTESPRVDVIYAQAVRPLIDGFRPMLDSLVQANQIRPVSDREIFFIVANGAASVHAFAPLSLRFTECDGAFDVDDYSRSAAKLIVEGLKVHPRR